MHLLICNLEVSTGELPRQYFSDFYIILSPNPPNGVVWVAEREIRDMEERLSGRFWTDGVSGRSAVVVSSRLTAGQDTSEDAHWPVWREFWVTLG